MLLFIILFHLLTELGYFHVVVELHDVPHKMHMLDLDLVLHHYVLLKRIPALQLPRELVHHLKMAAPSLVWQPRHVCPGYLIAVHSMSAPLKQFT